MLDPNNLPETLDELQEVTKDESEKDSESLLNDDDIKEDDIEALEKADSPPPKKKKSVSDRIGELTGVNHTLKREVAQLKQELHGLMSQNQESIMRAQQLDVENKKKALLQAKIEAKENQDFAKEVTIEEELSQLRNVPQSNSNAAQTENVHSTYFKEAYPWFGENKIKTALAKEIAEDVIKEPNFKKFTDPYYSNNPAPEYYNEVAKRVELEYGKQFQVNEARHSGYSSTETIDNRAPSSEDQQESLDISKAIRDFKRINPYISKQELTQQINLYKKTRQSN